MNNLRASISKDLRIKYRISHLFLKISRECYLMPTCKECGSFIDQEATKCPICGTSIDASTIDEHTTEYENSIPDLIGHSLLLLIFGIPLRVIIEILD